MNPKTTGAFIAALRKEKNLTQKQLADKLNVSDKAISRWETGKGYPDIEFLMELSQEFSVSINELLSGKRNETPAMAQAAEKDIACALIQTSRKKRISSAVAIVLAVVIVILSVSFIRLFVYFYDEIIGSSFMRYVASITVCVELILLISLSVYLVFSIKKNTQFTRLKRIVLIGACAIIPLMSIALYGDYVWPEEIQVKLTSHAVITVTGDQILDYPGQAFWHGAYEEYGVYAGSFHFNTEDPIDFYSWPPMDFNYNSYIISYGQRIVSLSYNVWDTIDGPIRTGAYRGYAELDDTFVPEEVYVYRIPKMRIDNGNPMESTPLQKNKFSENTFLIIIIQLTIMVLIEGLLLLFIRRKRGRGLTQGTELRVDGVSP